MSKLSSVGKGSFQAFKMAREAGTLYLWTIVEATQTISLSVYLAQSSEDWAGVEEMAKWNKRELAEPLKDVSNNVFSYICFPINIATEKFADAMIKSMDFYIEMAQDKQ